VWYFRCSPFPVSHTTGNLYKGPAPFAGSIWTKVCGYPNSNVREQLNTIHFRASHLRLHCLSNTTPLTYTNAHTSYTVTQSNLVHYIYLDYPCLNLALIPTVTVPFLVDKISLITPNHPKFSFIISENSAASPLKYHISTWHRTSISTPRPTYSTKKFRPTRPTYSNKNFGPHGLLITRYKYVSSQKLYSQYMFPQHIFRIHLNNI